jgi:diadenosine tetraphosphate (Ap4A) HIT family hydrolase
MASLRTETADKEYKDYRATWAPDAPCVLCTEKPLQTFKHWKILKNNFPYDRIADVHDMILPIRHSEESEITAEEWAEYQEIKAKVLHDKYEYFIEAVNRKKSVPAHFHIHLIVTKP